MRGEWIEIWSVYVFAPAKAASLPMRGEWIEIALMTCAKPWEMSLSPCGESGLKLTKKVGDGVLYVSLPMRGEWIEMKLCQYKLILNGVSPHAGRVD